MAFLRNVSSVGGLTLISRVTGYLRDLMMAHFIGVGAVSDAVALAMKLPALFRRLFAEGAFHVSFLPIFSGLLQKSEDREQPFLFASNAFSWLLLVVLTCTLLIEWQMPAFVATIFPGLKGKPETLALVIRLGRITFPYIVLISLVSFFGSLLNAFGRFALLAASHAIGNIFIIAWFCFFSGMTKDYGGLFSWAIVLSGIVQLLTVAIPCMRSGLRIRLCFPTLSPLMKQFLKKLGPGMLGVGVVQVNILVGFYLGSHLASGGISYLYYADRLNQLPLSIIGISLSSVLLPVLARHIHSNNVVAANKTQNHAVRFAASLSLPLVMMTACLAFPMACVLFGHGRLTHYDVIQVSNTIFAFSFGIPAYIAIKIMNARFFAEGQTKIPLYASCVGVVTDVMASLVLMPLFGHIGLAAAVAFSAWMHAGFLSFRLIRKKTWTLSRPSQRFLGRMMLSCLFVGVFLTVLQRAIPDFYHLSFFKQFSALVSFMATGMTVFIVCCFKMRVFSLRHMRLLWRSVKTA